MKASTPNEYEDAVNEIKNCLVEMCRSKGGDSGCTCNPLGGVHSWWCTPIDKSGYYFCIDCMMPVLDNERRDFRCEACWASCADSWPKYYHFWDFYFFKVYGIKFLEAFDTCWRD